MLIGSIFFWEEREGGGRMQKRKKKVVGSQVVGSMTWIVGHRAVRNRLRSESGYKVRYFQLKT